MLASRGVEGLVRNGGRMRLVVGCTLGEAEVEAIERGQQLKALVQERLGAMPLGADRGCRTSGARASELDDCAWPPRNEGRHPVRRAATPDRDNGPVPREGRRRRRQGRTSARVQRQRERNAQGWSGNWESFHVFTDWVEASDRRRSMSKRRRFRSCGTTKRSAASSSTSQMPRATGCCSFFRRTAPCHRGSRTFRLLMDEPRHADCRATHDQPIKGAPPDQSELRRLVWST